MQAMNSQVDYQYLPNILNPNEILPLLLFQLLSVATVCIFIIIPEKRKKVIVI
jgi:uncharacterized membrane protein